jgi:hypothetical protein
MRLTSNIVAAFCLCIPGTSPPPQPDTLAVHLNLQFDRSITSKTIKAVAKDEATAIWSVYGVDLQWTDQEVPAALCLDVIVERYGRHVGLDGSLSVLGRTTIAPGPAAQAPIRVSFDAIDSIIESGYPSSALLREYGVGIALGRVLAHELGHVLLGSPAYHDPDGLMRTTFLSNDLARPERSRFRLTDRSVARLRTRITSLSDAPPPASCTKPTT